MIRNPFSVVSPEELTAEEAHQLFVEMHSDYPEITRAGNTLITGARGCGKSMLIRCSLPDFIMLRDGINFSQLPYLALCVSIKKTSLNLQELHKLDSHHVPYLINEHFFSLQVVMQAFWKLSSLQYETEKYDKEAYKRFFNETYVRYMRASGCKDEINVNFDSAKSFFESLYNHLFDMSANFIPYLLGLFNTEGDLSYPLPLLSFTRFIVPVFSKMMELPDFPHGRPVLIFIDDADNLSKVQTEILNTWLASRTQPTISLKVSSQIGQYKTYLTSTGVLVESPHDYQEVNISFLYTTRSADKNYYKKACQILFKRLQLSGYAHDIDATDEAKVESALRNFFPSYKKQDDGIAAEEERIKKAYEEGGRGYRENDDIRRYAIPNYIRKLGGTSKSRHTYRYAGIENIIHLSSGIIRYLLDATAKMFDAVTSRYSKSSGMLPEQIPSDVQDSIMRTQADFYLFTELQKAEEGEEKIDSSILTSTSPRNTTDKLANLINAMGKTFHEILVSGNDEDPLSGRSERKVFSIALSNPERISKEVKSVFELGVRLGFLHQSHIGNKDGTGRTLLYVLNRCFAPIFTLDPTGFQGYLFMTNTDLTKAISSGKELRRIISNKSDRENDLFQISLFEEV